MTTKQVKKKTKKTRKSKYYYTPEESEYIEYVSGSAASTTASTKKKSGSFWDKAKDWGNKEMPSIQKYPYPIREPYKAAVAPASVSKDWAGRQAKTVGGWRERARIKNDLKLTKQEADIKFKNEKLKEANKYLSKSEKQKRKLTQREQEKKELMEKQRELALESIDGLHAKHAKSKEIRALRNKDGSLNMNRKGSGIKVNHLNRRDWIFGRKPQLVDAETVNKWKKEDPAKYGRYQKQVNRWDNKLARKNKLGNWFERRKEGKIGKLASREGSLEYAKGALDTSKRTIRRFGTATGEIGEALSETASHSLGPIQVFQLAYQRMSVTLKWLIIIVFLAVILFVPWGVFYYAGWAVGAAFMFLLALIYWVFISFFNGIAYVLVTLINGISRIIMGVVIFIVEVILDFFTKNGLMVVPNPAWASTLKTGVDPWTHPEYIKDKGVVQALFNEWGTEAPEHMVSGNAILVDSHYWFDGHLLLDGSLIRFEQIANVPALMFVSPPPWQDWMYNIIIVKLLEHIPGLSTLIKAWDENMGRGMSDALANFVATSPPWLVILVGIIPFLAIIGVVLYIYLKNKNTVALSR